MTQKELDELFGPEDDIPPIEEVGFTPEEMEIATRPATEFKQVAFRALCKLLADSIDAKLFTHTLSDGEDVCTMVVESINLSGQKHISLAKLIEFSETVRITRDEEYGAIRIEFINGMGNT